MLAESIPGLLQRLQIRALALCASPSLLCATVSIVLKVALIISKSKCASQCTFEAELEKEGTER
jgi:hypothetical protein